MTIYEAQNECRIRFPIGCKFISISDFDKEIETLVEDEIVYKLNKYHTSIFASEGLGQLYSTEYGFAELISLPKSKNQDYSYLEAFLNKLNIK